MWQKIYKKKVPELSHLELEQEEEDFLLTTYDILYDHDYAKLSTGSTWTCSEFAHNALEYLAGFVAFQLSKVLKCGECVSYLT